MSRRSERARAVAEARRDLETEFEKGVPGGYAELDLATGTVPVEQLATGTPTGSKFVADDGTLKVIPPTIPLAHVLATTAGLGPEHTTSGLTSGLVLRASGAATAAFAAIQDSDLPATIARDSEVTTAISTAITTHEGAADPHPLYTLSTELVAHEGAADPHTGYQKESEKNAASGYPGLHAVPGTMDDTTVLFGDGKYRSPSAGSTNIKQTEIDFGTTPVSEASFTVTDADVNAVSQLIGSVAYEAPTGKDLDEIEMDGLNLTFAPGVGEFTLYVRGMDGYVADKFKVNYLVG